MGLGEEFALPEVALDGLDVLELGHGSAAVALELDLMGSNVRKAHVPRTVVE